jgi:hypothetical protein
MLAAMDPVLDETRYQFISVTPQIAPRALAAAIATFREAMSAVVAQPEASDLGANGPVFARITLQVFSDLEAAGLTAAVASALAAEGIACNMIAALHHDHAFVPQEKAADAMAILQDLAAQHQA